MDITAPTENFFTDLAPAPLPVPPKASPPRRQPSAEQLFKKEENYRRRRPPVAKSHYNASELDGTPRLLRHGSASLPQLPGTKGRYPWHRHLRSRALHLRLRQHPPRHFLLIPRACHRRPPRRLRSPLHPAEEKRPIRKSHHALAHRHSEMNSVLDISNESSIPSEPVRVHLVFCHLYHDLMVFSAEPLPLSTSYWKDPAFLKSFNGSYRIEATHRAICHHRRARTSRGNPDPHGCGKTHRRIGETLRSSPLTKKSAALTFNLGNLYFETGEIEKAVAAYQSALKEYPSFRRAHQNLALALVREKQTPRSPHPPHRSHPARRFQRLAPTVFSATAASPARNTPAPSKHTASLRSPSQTSPNGAPESPSASRISIRKQEAVALLDEVIRKRPLEASYSVLQANILLDLDQSGSCRESP